jgi:hypothetical protein
MSDAPPLLTSPVDLPAVCPVCETASQLPTCGTCGWELVGDLVLGRAGPQAQEMLDAELAKARQCLHAGAESRAEELSEQDEAVANDEVVPQMGDDEPLLQDYALVVAQPTTVPGRFITHTQTLFAKGSDPSSPAPQVRVSAPPGTTTGERVRLEIPVVALTGDRREDWTLVQVMELDLAPDESVLLTFQLVRPSQVEITANAGVIRPSTATWSDLLERFDRCQRGVPLNVVVAVELGGPENDARVEATIEVIERVEQGRSSSPVQVATILYWDHDLQPRSGRSRADEPPRIRPFKPVSEVLGDLRDLVQHDGPVRYPYAVALEDALHGAASLRGGRDGNWALLVAATRAPHPANDLEDETAVRSCPNKLDWRSALRSRDGWIGRTVILVRAESAHNTMAGREARRRAARIWAEFERYGWDVIELDAFNAAEIAADKLAPESRSTRSVPFPVISSH